MRSDPVPVAPARSITEVPTALAPATPPAVIDAIVDDLPDPVLAARYTGNVGDHVRVPFDGELVGARVVDIRTPLGCVKVELDHPVDWPSGTRVRYLVRHPDDVLRA